jgi:ribonuclease PH
MEISVYLTSIAAYISYLSYFSAVSVIFYKKSPTIDLDRSGLPTANNESSLEYLEEGIEITRLVHIFHRVALVSK